MLVTHLLEGGVYREPGRFTAEVVMERPVLLRFRLSQLLGGTPRCQARLSTCAGA